VEPSQSIDAPNDLSEQTEEKQHFKTVKINTQMVDREFICSIEGNDSAHIIAMPMLCICCGQSACYECIKLKLSEKLDECPICHVSWLSKPLIVFNH